MRSYKIQEVIKRRQVILVQVVKEERGNKGAALTTYLSLAGRYTVLMPNTARGGGISRKITQPQDRKRLKAIAQELEVPEGMGLIIRTAGAARTKQEIKRDFEYLLRLWESVRDLTLQSQAPSLVYEEGNLIKRSIRDLYNKDVDEVIVAGGEAHREAKDFMRMLMPSHAKNVTQYQEPEPLFARYPDRAAAERHVQPVRDAALGRLPRHQPDRGAGLHRRQLRQGDARVLHRGDGAQHQPGGIRRDRPPAQAARPRRPHRHRLHRHGGAAQQPQGREPPEGCAAPRPGPHPGRAHQPLRPPGDVAPAPAHGRAGGLDLAMPALPGHGHHPLGGIGVAGRAAGIGGSAPARRAQLSHRGDDRRRRLYILNNKRAFVTDMERRYGITIAVQASDRMQGANFAIERSAVQLAPQRTVERAVVNMESGFEGQEGDEEPVAEEAAEAPAERDDGGRRSRRRRRRGRRDDRPDDRAPYRGGERAEFAGNGEADEMRPEHADANREPQPRHDLAEPLDEPAGTGEQPSIAHGDSDREGGRGDQRDRPRRRRGRRGGRRGRDRDEAPRDQTDELGARPAEESGNGAGAHEDREPQPQAPAETATAEPIPYAEPSHAAAAAERQARAALESQRQPGRPGRGPA
jgi:ribonuclease E